MNDLTNLFRPPLHEISCNNIFINNGGTYFILFESQIYRHFPFMYIISQKTRQTECWLYSIMYHQLRKM